MARNSKEKDRIYNRKYRAENPLPKDYWKNWLKNNPHQKKRIYDRFVKYLRANPEKISARNAVNYAVRTGKLIRPNKCEKCGSENVKIQADHHDYSKKLDVTWLCIPCHKEITSSRMFD